MSWTQGEHDRQAAQKEVGQREREGEAKAISEERDKTATNSSNIGGGIAQNLNDKQTERQRDKQTERQTYKRMDSGTVKQTATFYIQTQCDRQASE